MTTLRSQLGATLIELVITIVVLSIGLSTILGVMNQNLSTSSDPLVQQQGIAIAEAYLEEISDKPFSDPGGPAELGRADYDDINDYTAIIGLVPQDQNGNAIAGLGNYLVTVTVTNESLGPGGNQAPMADSFRITVAVTTPLSGSVPLTISAYRTNYF